MISIQSNIVLNSDYTELLEVLVYFWLASIYREYNPPAVLSESLKCLQSMVISSFQSLRFPFSISWHHTTTKSSTVFQLISALPFSLLSYAA